MVETAERMITVRGMFGDVRVTKAKFVSHCREHAEELRKLSWKHYVEVSDMVNRIAEIAADRFEEIYESEKSRSDWQDEKEQS